MVDAGASAECYPLHMEIRRPPYTSAYAPSDASLDADAPSHTWPDDPSEEPEDSFTTSSDSRLDGPFIKSAYEPPVDRQPSRVGTFFKWLLALVGLFMAVLGLELLASFIIVASVDAIDSFAAGLGFGEGAWYAFLLSDDGSMAQSLFIQLVWFVAVVPWWFHVRRHGIGLSRGRGQARDGAVQVAGQDAGRDLLKRLLAIVMLGVGLQVVISIILTLVLPLFPEVHESYDSMMEDSGTTTFSLLTVLSVAVAAPVVEETTFRGIAFQFSLRAVCPEWRGNLQSWEYDRIHVSKGQFWTANILQAVVFGVMHLNITQGLYAFAIGLVAGWVFWRTGKLRWGMGLHAVLNFASYFVGEILDVCGLFGLISPVGEFLVPVLLVLGGIRLFRQGTERYSEPEPVQNNGPGQDAGPVASA